MGLQTFIKITNVSNLSDARYCAGMGVDQLGFKLTPDEADSITPELFLEISNWIAGVEYVGEFGNLPAEQVIEIQKQLPLNYIEISDLNNVERVRSVGRPIIFKLTVNDDSEVEKLDGTLAYLDELVEYVIIESDESAIHEKIDLKVSFYHGRLKLIRAFGLNSENVAEIKGYAGLQLVGTEEEEPGLKDYGEIMDILEVLEVD